MLEEISTQGYWWVESDEDRTVAGELSYQPGGRIELKLLSPIDERATSMAAGEAVEYDRIHGVTEDGDEVTLLNCTRSSASLNMGNSGVQTSEFVATHFLTGHAFTQGEDITFKSATVEFPLLDEWAGITGVSIDYGFGDMSSDGPVTVDAGDTVDIEYEFQDSYEVDLGDFSVSLSVNADINTQRVGGVSVDETTRFRVEPNDGTISKDELMDVVNKLQNFITLATRKTTFPSSLEGKVPTESEYGDSVTLYFDQRSEMESPSGIHPSKTNFTFSDIHEEFEEVLSTWFDLYSQLKPTFDLYFGAQHNENMYPRNQFLGYTQALETYHRRSSYDGEYLEEEEFEDYYEQLCDGIPNEFPDSFSDHLEDGTFKYANEYSLRKRMAELVDDYGSVLQEVPWDIEDKVGDIVDTRNDLTHQGNASVSAVELYELNLVLESIIEATLLADLGIPEEFLNQRLGERYQELARGI